MAKHNFKLLLEEKERKKCGNLDSGINKFWIIGGNYYKVTLIREIHYIPCSGLKISKRYGKNMKNKRQKLLLFSMKRVISGSNWRVILIKK